MAASPLDRGRHAAERKDPLVIATILRREGFTGVQTYVSRLSEYLRGTGTEPLVITPFSRSPILASAVFAPRPVIDRFSGPAAVVWYRFWHYVFLRRALRHTLATLDSTVVCAQCPLSALAALKARRRVGQRVVLVVHFDSSQADEWADAGRIRRDGRVYRRIQKLERSVYLQMDRIIWVSQASRDHSYARAADPGLEAVFPGFASAGEPETAKEHDLVSVGSLKPVKNQAFLLDVLAAAARRGHRYSLDLIGDGSLRRVLEQRVADLGLDHQVRFLGNREDVQLRLPRYRAYVHAAMSENLPLAIVEAMSAGLPVFAAPVGGIPELVEPGVEGEWWTLDDPDGAARRLIEVMEDSAALSRMAAAARDKFERRFAVEVVGPALEYFLRSVEPREEGPGQLTGPRARRALSASQPSSRRGA